MICVSLAGISYVNFSEVLKEINFAEIRLDQADISLNQIEHLFCLPVRLIATFRPGKTPDILRKEALIKAISAGAAYVDVELESSEIYRNEIIHSARKYNCKVIVSYHNYSQTPSEPEIKSILTGCFKAGANIAKISCQVHSYSDCARLLSLYNTEKSIIAIGIGKKGIITRIAAPFLGAPFTFASLSPGKETAAGQLPRNKMREILNLIKSK